MTTITLRMPEDVVADLKRVAPRLGFGGYQPLMRAYVDQGLRVDLERLEGELRIADLIESLRRQGIDEKVLSAALTQARVEGGVESTSALQAQAQSSPASRRRPQAS